MIRARVDVFEDHGGENVRCFLEIPIPDEVTETNSTIFVETIFCAGTSEEYYSSGEIFKNISHAIKICFERIEKNIERYVDYSISAKKWKGGNGTNKKKLG